MEEVIWGLSGSKKYIDVKYQYDDAGFKAFVKLQSYANYYVYGCELEIFRDQVETLVQQLFPDRRTHVSLVDLGVGDGSKTMHLLRYLMDNHYSFTYYPIDISGSAVQHVQEEFPNSLPGLQLKGLTGEFLDMLGTIDSAHPKVVLFLGSTIGNLTLADATAFCADVRKHLSPGDKFLIGFDLKKSPAVITKAYARDLQDSEGFGPLNILLRLNRELKADFVLDNFEAYSAYDPETAMRNAYIISLHQQTINIGSHAIQLEQYEAINMGMGKKYRVDEVHQMRDDSGYKQVADLFDNQRWVLVSIWEVLPDSDSVKEMKFGPAGTGTSLVSKP